MKKAYRKILCLILSAVMIIVIIPAVELKVDAAKIYTSEDGQWLYTKQSDDKLLYSRGEFNDYCARLVRYLGNDINVSIPDKIDGLEVFIIGKQCFYGDIIDIHDVADINALDAIKSITIGPDIYEIEDEAFAFMDSLEEVVFSDERPAYSEPLFLNYDLFAESEKLASLELPQYRDYDAYDFLCNSYIKNLTAPGSLFNKITTIKNSEVEHLTLTGETRLFAESFSFLTNEKIKTIEFKGSSSVSGSLEITSPSPELPDLIFHHIPPISVENKLIAAGYVKNYDYESGKTSFSVNNIPDTKYISATDPVRSGDFEYSLTAEGNAIISNYFGYEENLAFPDEIDGHSVIAIGNNNVHLRVIYGRDILSITIPEGVEYIGKEAFKGWKTLERVSFPDSLKTIESRAFYDCQSLREIILPAVTYMGCGVFWECTASKISIPGTLKEVPQDAFRSVRINQLEELIIAEGVESIGQAAFRNLHLKKSENGLFLNLPSTLNYIGEFAFSGLNIAGDLVIPNGVEEINSFAFRSYSNLNTVIFPEGLKLIGEGAFRNCSTKATITVPDSVVRICSYAFSELKSPEVIIPEGIKVIEKACFCKSAIDYLCLPEGINEISDGVFALAEIGDLSVPNSVSYYGTGEYPFDQCKINNFVLGNSAVDLYDSIAYRAEINNLLFADGAVVPENAFSYCNIGKLNINAIYTKKNSFFRCSIEELEISGNAEYIDECALSNTSEIKKLVFSAKRCKSAKYLLKSIKGLSDFSFGDDIEYIPAGLFLDSSYAESFRIPQTVTQIYDEAFRGAKFTELNLPENLEYIGRFVFADCTELQTITIPESVATIGTSAFYGCASLETVNFLPKNCNMDYTDISTENGVFENCPNLQTFNFGDGVKYIPDYLFKGFINIESITIPDSVTDIGSYSFANTNLKNIVLPDGIESMGDGCFENCKELETAVINSNIMLIGDNTFRGCDKLREIYIADSVMDIGRTSFSGCTSLETVYMSKNVVYIPERCFENCTALSSFTWESDSKLIGKLAFSGCTSLTVFDFTGIAKLYPNSFQGSGIGVASLGEARNEAAAALQVVEAQSFMSCPELQTVALGGNVNTVQTKAFANCENLETAIISDSVETIAPDAFENCPKLTIYCSESSYAYNYATSNDIKVSTFIVEPIPNQKYTGRVIEPEVKVSLSGNPLARNEDFRVRYTDNVNVGTAAAKVSGINDYKMFTSTVHFAIISRNISEAEIGSIADQSYKGGEVTPKVKVTYNGKTLREGTDYNVIYTSNDSAGTAKATIIGTGNYSGTYTVTFNIVESPAGDNPADEPGNNPEENTSFIRTVLNFFMRIIAAFRNLFAGFFTV